MKEAVHVWSRSKVDATLPSQAQLLIADSDHP
jgi:hypothetical protein